MPIYEFVCSKCNAEFDKLTSFDWKSAGVNCPDCGSTELKRTVSLVGVKSGGKMLSSDSEACTTCSTGSCSTCH